MAKYRILKNCEKIINYLNKEKNYEMLCDIYDKAKSI